MAQTLNQVPPELDVWDVAGQLYLVRLVPNTQPPIPLVWKLAAGDKEALGVKTVDRKFGSVDEFYKTGPLQSGTTRELINTTTDPWEQIQSNYETEVRVKPWLGEDEILALWLGAALEGRSITEAELQGTDWWRTHSEGERQWLSLNASDPATADQLIADNRTRVADMFNSAGVGNATDVLVSRVADLWTTGEWSQIYATNQIRLLADPNLSGTLDPILRAFKSGVDTTREGEDVVKDMIGTWLGPAASENWTQTNIEKWAGRLREDPDARLELEDALRKHRLALFPEYENANLTYEDIAAPWRGVWSNVWGQVADETNPLFSKIVRLNDRAAAEGLLRKEGLKQGNQNVAQNVLSDVGSAFGGQVRRADAAVL
jgi:hypothetical protein